MSEAPSIGTCPICLRQINLGDEAFVKDCLHHFCFQCIKKWATSTASSPVLCPVCKTPFTTILYDCFDTEYSEWHVAATTTTTTKNSNNNKGFGLTPAHRRRRSMYSTGGRPIEHTMNETTTTTAADDVQGRATPRPIRTRITAAQLERPAVMEWLKRELQAILLQHDVDLIAQCVMGLLRRGMSTNAQKNKTMEVEGAVEVVEQGVASYLSSHSGLLAKYFVEFIASGLNVAAHDAAVFEIVLDNDGIGSEDESLASEASDTPPSSALDE